VFVSCLPLSLINFDLSLNELDHIDFTWMIFVKVSHFLQIRFLQCLSAQSDLLEDRIIRLVHQFRDVVSQEGHNHHEQDQGEKHVVTDTRINVQSLLHFSLSLLIDYYIDA
jgi:hypothetical protein